MSDKARTRNAAMKLVKKSKTPKKVGRPVNDTNKSGKKRSDNLDKSDSNISTSPKKAEQKRVVLKRKRIKAKIETENDKSPTGQSKSPPNKTQKGNVEPKTELHLNKGNKKLNDNKSLGKGVKRKRSNSGEGGKKPSAKRKTIDNDDDDDDDILYSVIEDDKHQNQKVVSSDPNIKRKSKKKTSVSPTRKKEDSPNACIEKSKSCSEIIDNAKSSTITSTGTNFSNRRLSLISGLKTKPIKPKTLPTQLVHTPKDEELFKEPQLPETSSLYYTSVKPLLTTPSLLSKPMPSHTIVMESYFGDIPSYQIANMVPGSPSAMSYKALLENLPQQMHPKKKKKDFDTESDDGQIERRTSVRSAECAFRNKDIVVKKCHRYTQIWLNTQTRLKNVLNPQVIQEIVTALNSAKYDDSNLVMFSSIGNVFCSGVDLNFLTTGDPKIAARKMVDSLRELVKTFITFPKPIVAVVTGAAVGLGMAILPLCDITYASDKALFYLPYSTLSQTPEGCSSFTLPQVLGLAMGSELLFCGRKVTALEAHQLGLVSQVFWPTSMMQEVIPRVQQMALFSGKALETTKLLIRCHNRTKLELTNETECNLLLERWPTSECQRAILAYLDDEKNFIY